MDDVKSMEEFTRFHELFRNKSFDIRREATLDAVVSPKAVEPLTREFINFMEMGGNSG